MLIAVCLLALSSVAGEPPREGIVVKEGMRFEAGPMVIGEEVVGEFEIQVPVPRAEGPHVTLGKAAEWVINNTVKHNGWSFTGWSKTGLDEDFRPWRLHIGIISGELDASLADNLTEKSHCTPSYQLLEEWEQRRQNDFAVGIVFTKRF
jgi:hypothetical protein